MLVRFAKFLTVFKIHGTDSMDIWQTQDTFTGPASASATRLLGEVISNELHTIRSTRSL